MVGCGCLLIVKRTLKKEPNTSTCRTSHSGQDSHEMAKNARKLRIGHDTEGWHMLREDDKALEPLLRVAHSSGGIPQSPPVIFRAFGILSIVPLHRHSNSDVAAVDSVDAARRKTRNCFPGVEAGDQLSAILVDRT